MNDLYEKETYLKYHETKEYRDYLEKTNGYSKEDFKNVNNKFKNIFYEFSLLFINNMKFDDEVVQQKVESLQKFISKNYYECSNEVLKSLGELYIQDVRFKSFIDSYQEGTALFISKAIDYYCLLNK